jgi:hypothetical protein
MLQVKFVNQADFFKLADIKQRLSLSVHVGSIGLPPISLRLALGRELIILLGGEAAKYKFYIWAWNGPFFYPSGSVLRPLTAPHYKALVAWSKPKLNTTKTAWIFDQQLYDDCRIIKQFLDERTNEHQEPDK